LPVQNSLRASALCPLPCRHAACSTAGGHPAPAPRHSAAARRPTAAPCVHATLPCTRVPVPSQPVQSLRRSAARAPRASPPLLVRTCCLNSASGASTAPPTIGRTAHRAPSLKVGLRMKTVGNCRKRTYDIEKQKRSVRDISIFSN
jgi:hypothetical protein